MALKDWKRIRNTSDWIIFENKKSDDTVELDYMQIKNRMVWNISFPKSRNEYRKTKASALLLAKQYMKNN